MFRYIIQISLSLKKKIHLVLPMNKYIGHYHPLLKLRLTHYSLPEDNHLHGIYLGSEYLAGPPRIVYLGNQIHLPVRMEQNQENKRSKKAGNIV